jgi:hypothetical protein
VKQIAKLERITSHARAVKSRLLPVPVPPQNPALHHIIAESSKVYFHLTDFVTSRSGDPAAMVCYSLAFPLLRCLIITLEFHPQVQGSYSDPFAWQDTIRR